MKEPIVESTQITKIKYKRKHWIIMIYSIVLLFFMVGMTVDGLNAIIPGLVKLRGWDANTILSISTPATMIALFVTMFFGKMIEKIGLKTTTILCLIVGGLSTVAYGQARSIATYAIALTAMMTFVNGFAIICGFSIGAQWFPRTKGYVYGITTIGMNFASALIVPTLTVLSHVFTDNPDGDISIAITIMGITMVIIAIYTHFFIQATPEEAGELPDNMPYDNSYLKEHEDEGTTMTYRQIFARKETWLTGISNGCNGLATVGIMSQLVPYFMFRGYEQNMAIATLSITAIIGIAGSYLWGIIDQKIGTKKAQIYFSIFYGIGIILLTMQNKILMFLGLVLLGMGIGGNGNFPASMTTSLFGRKDFSNAYSIVNTIVGVVRSLAFVVLAILLAKTGGNFVVAYNLFAGIAIIGAIIAYFIKIPEIPGGFK